MSHYWRTLTGEGHSVADRGIGGSLAADSGSKIFLFRQLASLITLRCILLMLVSMPLHVVNWSWSGFPVSNDINVVIN